MTIDYSHLVGRPFVWGSHDCFGLVRDFFHDVFAIELPDIARPEDFWSHGLKLFEDNYAAMGFTPVHIHPTDARCGDVLVCAIDSEFGNHCGVFLEDGFVLHHLYSGLSRRDPFRGLIYNTRVAIYRHREVEGKLTKMESTADFRDFLSPAMQRKLDALRQPDPATA